MFWPWLGIRKWILKPQNSSHSNPIGPVYSPMYSEIHVGMPNHDWFFDELGKDEEKDNDEENDGFFVPHGYLSSDEEQNDNGKF